MIENDGMFTDLSLHIMFLQMKARMKEIAARMNEQLKARFNLQKKFPKNNFIYFAKREKESFLHLLAAAKQYSAPSCSVFNSSSIFCVSPITPLHIAIISLCKALNLSFLLPPLLPSGKVFSSLLLS